MAEDKKKTEEVNEELEAMLDSDTKEELNEQAEELTEGSEEESPSDDAKSAETAPADDNNPATETSPEDENLREALMRERADFLNFKTRAAKEQERARGFGKTAAVRELLPAFDEIDRARKAGEIEEGSPFDKIAQKFDEAVSKIGVTKFAEKGEVFDPNLHHALMNREAKDEDGLTAGEVRIDEVVSAGYKLGEELIRTAEVVTVSA